MKGSENEEGIVFTLSRWPRLKDSGLQMPPEKCIIHSQARNSPGASKNDGITISQIIKNTFTKSNDTEDRALALHMANMGSIFGVLYDLYI